MKIPITGATGYIGRAVAEELMIGSYAAGGYPTPADTASLIPGR